jgi:hypothetical protein
MLIGKDNPDGAAVLDLSRKDESHAEIDGSFPSGRHEFNQVFATIEEGLGKEFDQSPLDMEESAAGIDQVPVYLRESLVPIAVSGELIDLKALNFGPQFGVLTFKGSFCFFLRNALHLVNLAESDAAFVRETMNIPVHILKIHEAVTSGIVCIPNLSSIQAAEEKHIIIGQIPKILRVLEVLLKPPLASDVFIKGVKSQFVLVLDYCGVAVPPNVTKKVHT